MGDPNPSRFHTAMPLALLWKRAALEKVAERLPKEFGEVGPDGLTFVGAPNGPEGI